MLGSTRRKGLRQSYRGALGGRGADRHGKPHLLLSPEPCRLSLDIRCPMVRFLHGAIRPLDVVCLQVYTTPILQGGSYDT
jgi:hypothetical protein